jgi:hypothetical protein
MRSRLSGILFAAAVLAGGSACRSSSPAAPSPIDPIVGTWTGVITDRARGLGSFRLVITDRKRGGAVPIGQWSATFSRGGGGGGAAPYSSDSDGTIALFGECLPGSISFNLSLSDGALQGSYFGFSCPVLTSGTVSLKR